MKKVFGLVLVAAIIVFVRPAAAALYDKGQPLFFQAQKTEKDREAMLRGFELILKDEPLMEDRVVEDHGIEMLLQSPLYGYEQGKDFFLFLRFKPVDSRYVMRFNMLGSFEIEMIDMTRAKIEAASYVFDDDYKKKLVHDGVEAVSLGASEVSVPEVNIIFNLGDFNFAPPADGVYRIKITYRSESPDNSVWTGIIASNPILIEVGQVK
jgi:hypothetical protein